MKKRNNISQKWRKLTAVILLLNFFIAPLLIAFPTEECDGMCSVNSEIHTCDITHIESTEMDCCDMMDMNLNNTVSYNHGMEFSDINCAFIIHEKVNSSYLIPRANDNKTEFVPITIIDFEKENLKVELFELKLDFSLRDKPPLYLFNESFLI